MHTQLLSYVWLICDPMACSLLGSSVHGIFQARILEWVAIFSFRDSSWPRWLVIYRLNLDIYLCISRERERLFEVYTKIFTWERLSTIRIENWALDNKEKSLKNIFDCVIRKWVQNSALVLKTNEIISQKSIRNSTENYPLVLYKWLCGYDHYASRRIWWNHKWAMKCTNMLGKEESLRK